MHSLNEYTSPFSFFSKHKERAKSLKNAVETTRHENELIHLLKSQYKLGFFNIDTMDSGKKVIIEGKTENNTMEFYDIGPVSSEQLKKHEMRYDEGIKDETFKNILLDGYFLNANRP